MVHVMFSLQFEEICYGFTALLITWSCDVLQIYFLLSTNDGEATGGTGLNAISGLCPNIPVSALRTQ